ncbi:hypothetical protein ACF1HJ_35380 [Streptomyces sp. NPDC013978]
MTLSEELDEEVTSVLREPGPHLHGHRYATHAAPAAVALPVVKL